MAIRSIDTVVDIAEDRRLVVQLPADVAVGKHRLVATQDEALESPQSATTPWTFPVLEGTTWPPGLTWRREDLYAE